jgi:formylglycine-generating enzyme required for sulfatase activity
MLDREITVQQWNSCALDVTSKAIASPAGQEPLPPNSPKQNISWLDAQSFCLTLKTAVPLLCAEGCEVRLPTEIEWEYAGRGGLGLTYPWVTHGSSTDRFLGFARGVATAPVPVDVLSNKDVAWRGQFDLAGNLSEWCLDQYEQSLHEALAARHVQGTLTYDPADNALVKAALAGKEGDGNPSRTLRGGSIVDGPEACELPMRRFLPQNKGAEHIGFRPVIIIRKTAHATVEEQQ